MKKIFALTVLAVFSSQSSPQAFAAVKTHGSGDTIEVVESVPVETTLAVPGIRDAQTVWLEMINSAQTSIDLEQFYVSDQAGQELAPVLAAIAAAAQRGVKVRLLVDLKYFATYPDSVRQIGALPNSEARTIDFSSMGGVQHAKYFVVDGNLGFVGSQNFDWRALNQIHEVGVRLTDPAINADLETIFERDWNSGVVPKHAGLESLPFGVITGPNPFGQSPAGDYVVASPAQANPQGIADTLSAVTALIGGAQSAVRVQVMEYTTSVYGSSTPWKALDTALRAAAKRGVHVQLMVDVSDIAKAKTDLTSLAALKNVEVRSVTIPQASTGPIPYARLIHSKYLIVDDSLSWVGSENWSEGYFMNTRDVGIMIRTQSATANLVQIFNQVWGSGYASSVK